MEGEALDRAIQGAQAGDRASLDLLIDHFAGRVFGFLYRMTGSRHDAEDLMQEVFVRLVRMIGAYQHDGRFEPWIFRIAANLVRDRLRRTRRGPRIVSMSAVGSDDESGGFDAMAETAQPVDAGLVHGEDLGALGMALKRLPEAEREVVMLRHFSQMSFKEIAEATGVPLGTALARGHRGLARLRELMTGESGEGRHAAVVAPSERGVVRP